MFCRVGHHSLGRNWRCSPAIGSTAITHACIDEIQMHYIIRGHLPLALERPCAQDRCL